MARQKKVAGNLTAFYENLEKLAYGRKILLWKNKIVIQKNAKKKMKNFYVEMM